MDGTITVIKKGMKIEQRLYAGTKNIRYGFEYFVEALGGLAYYFDKAKNALIIF